MQGLYQGIAGTIGSNYLHSSHNYSSEWKSLLLGLSKIKGAVSPALGHFFPSVGHSPPLKEIKSHQFRRHMFISYSFYLHELVCNPILPVPLINEVS